MGCTHRVQKEKEGGGRLRFQLRQSSPSPARRPRGQHQGSPTVDTVRECYCCYAGQRLIFEVLEKDKRDCLRKSLSRRYGALLMVRQTADLRARCCVSPNFPSLTSAHPVSMLVVLVGVATLQLQLWLSAKFMEKATLLSGQFDHVPAIVESPH